MSNNDETRERGGMTKGEWRVVRTTKMPPKTPNYPASEHYDEHASWKVVDDDLSKGNPMMHGNLICHVYNHAASDCEGNARAIAALPELIGALQEVLAHGVTHEVGCSHREETCSCCRGRAQAALKKAGVV